MKIMVFIFCIISVVGFSQKSQNYRDCSNSEWYTYIENISENIKCINDEFSKCYPNSASNIEEAKKHSDSLWEKISENINLIRNLHCDSILSEKNTYLYSLNQVEIRYLGLFSGHDVSIPDAEAFTAAFQYSNSCANNLLGTLNYLEYMNNFKRISRGESDIVNAISTLNTNINTISTKLDSVNTKLENNENELKNTRKKLMISTIAGTCLTTALLLLLLI